MVRRLIIDLVWRKKLWVGFMGFQIYLVGQPVWKIWPSADALAVTMAGAGFLTMGLGDAFSTRELYQLPVSRRTWWLASWWLRSLGAALIVTGGVAAAQWRLGHGLPDLDRAAMTVAWSVLYCGGAITVHVAFRNFADAPAPTPFSVLGVIPLFFALILVPFVTAPYLPHTFRSITVASALVLLASAALAARGYLYQPPIEPRLVGFRQRLPSVSAGSLPARHVPVAAGRASFADRLTGWPLALWDESRKYLIAFATVIGLLVAGWALASQVRLMPVLPEFLRLVGALPFASRTALITEPMTWGALLVVTIFIDSWMVESIRGLRALPVSAARLACLPVAMGVVTTATLFLVMLALHLLVLGALPVSPRIDLFVAFAAVSAGSQSIRFLAPGQPAAKGMLSFVPVAAIWLALGYFADSWRADGGAAMAGAVQTTMLVGGLLGLALCWAVMRRALTHSSRIYRVRTSVMPLV